MDDGEKLHEFICFLFLWDMLDFPSSRFVIYAQPSIRENTAFLSRDE